mmetsp:Transcript_7860/g.20284  ORF Transcript_7860/g.20284 Transcript_7860/m.20284 type:complete len:292 (-) Transcript_7860:38-913(-)
MLLAMQQGRECEPHRGKHRGQWHVAHRDGHGQHPHRGDHQLQQHNPFQGGRTALEQRLVACVPPCQVHSRLRDRAGQGGDGGPRALRKAELAPKQQLGNVGQRQRQLAQLHPWRARAWSTEHLNEYAQLSRQRYHVGHPVQHAVLLPPLEGGLVLGQREGQGCRHLQLRVHQPRPPPQRLPQPGPHPPAGALHAVEREPAHYHRDVVGVLAGGDEIRKHQLPAHGGGGGGKDLPQQRLSPHLPGGIHRRVQPAARHAVRPPSACRNSPRLACQILVRGQQKASPRTACEHR